MTRTFVPDAKTMLSLDKVYKVPRLWMTAFVAFLNVTTKTVTYPAKTCTAPVRLCSSLIRSISGRVVDGAKGTAKRIVVGTGLSFLMLWTSVLLYACFYHTYVPTASLVRPAHFEFRVCPSGVGVCSFPKANVTLCPSSCAEVLGRGQQYQVILQLLIPDSTLNRDAGMFMVHGHLYDQHGRYVRQSSRTVSVKYQSDMFKLMHAIVLFPLYFTALMEEIQTLKIELFEDFRDDYYQPAVGVLLEIHSRLLSFYSAELQFHACYSGLKYYLFYYPVVTAVCGVVFNCLWMTAIFLVTWYRLGVGALQELLLGLTADFSSSTAEENDEDGEEYSKAGEGRAMMNGDLGNSECCGEELEEEVTYYVQPFTVATLAQATEASGESNGGSTHVKAVAETQSHQQHVKSARDGPTHIQPFTVVSLAPKGREMCQEEAEPPTAQKMAADSDEGREVRRRKKWLFW